MIALNRLPVLPLLLLASLLVYFLAWLGSLPVRAEFEDLVTQRAYLEDPSGDLTVEEVSQADYALQFTPFDGPLYRGNRYNPVWLRLQLKPSQLPNWQIMVQPNSTHHAEIWFAPQPHSEQWTKVEVGSKHPHAQRELKELVPSARIKADPQEAQTVFVRVVTPTTPVYARVVPRLFGVSFDSTLHLVGGMFVGVGLLLTIGSLMVYLATRDSLWMMDSVYNMSGLLVYGFQLGLVGQYLLPDTTNVVSNLGLLINAMHLALSSLMYYRIFQLFSVPRTLLAFPLFGALLFPVLVLLIVNGLGDVAMRIANITILALTLVGIACVVTSRHVDRVMLWIFRISYSGLLAYMLFWTGSIVLKLDSDSLAPLYPNIPIALFSMFVMLLVLMRNTQLKLLEASRVAKEKLQAEMALSTAKKRHEESSSFYGMLLHEVKNPLSTIRMAVSNLEYTFAGKDEAVAKRLARVQAAVDDVDEVLRRGVEVDTLEQGALVLQPSPVDVAAVVEDICTAHHEASRIRLQLPASLVVKTDGQVFTLMLGNLVGNALKYAKADTQIDVALRMQADGFWCLEVRNQVGPVGFPDESKVFKKYYRSPLAAKRSGMGLGLYWVRSVARYMGGDAHFARDADWVVFELCLPT